jgi:hypothetical protein
MEFYAIKLGHFIINAFFNYVMKIGRIDSRYLLCTVVFKSNSIFDKNQPLIGTTSREYELLLSIFTHVVF